MGHGDYERLTPEAIDQVWLRLRAGQAAKPTARELGLCTGTVRAYLLRCGGIRPDPRRRATGRLSLAEREEISRGLAAGESIRTIAVTLGRAPSTVSREVNANGGRRRYPVFDLDVTVWGWIHMLLGALVATTGWALLARKTWAGVMAIVLASLSAIANFFFIPYYPVWSIVVIALDIWVIWAVTRPGAIDT